MSNARALAICAGLALAPAVALGLGRFAYALVLPAMRADLGWSYAAAGSLNSANAAGHLAGALLAIWLIRRFGAARVVGVGIVLTALGILATGLSDRLESLLALRFLPGLTGAAAFVAGGVLTARAVSPLGPRAALGVGLFYAGSGVGIMLSAGLVTPLVAGTPEAWPLAWGAMGAVALALSFPVVLAARAVGDEKGETDDEAGGGAVSLRPALLGYGLYAAGYVGYITFIIAAVREAGDGAGQSALWWAGLGLAAIAAVWLWAGLLRWSHDGWALGVLIGLTGLGAALPLLAPGPVGFAVSFALFGTTFLSVVTATTNLVRLARPRAAWAAGIAHFTLAFGIGQTLGPVASGAVADAMASSDGVLWTSSALLFAGAAVSLQQRRVA